MLKLVQVNNSLQQLCLQRCGLSNDTVERIQLAIKLRTHNNEHDSSMFTANNVYSSYLSSSANNGDNSEMTTSPKVADYNGRTQASKNSCNKNIYTTYSVLQRQNE